LVRAVYSRAEAIVATLLGLGIAATIWGPVLLRPFQARRVVDLGTLTRGEAGPLPLAAAQGQPAALEKRVPTQPVDINRADLTALQRLPGIGPVLARRIVSHRQARGPFDTPEQLMEVDGIGTKRFARLKPLIEAR
jgi:competence ComEA-like helix-hairpin-helix protein